MELIKKKKIKFGAVNVKIFKENTPKNNTYTCLELNRNIVYFTVSYIKKKSFPVGKTDN